jgi:membrane-associated phospholipid phosphatase
MLFEDSTVEAVRDPLPSWVVDLFGIVTGLGDPLFFIVLVSLLYWLTDHRTGIQVIAALVLVFGLTAGLKELLAIERPPAELRAIEAEGFGIPSGHASGSTAVYGTLAALYDWGSRRLRYATVAVLAGLVSLSRLVIGVHYVADVVAGIALGLAVVALVVRYRDRSPAPFFAVGAATALVGAWLSGFTYEPGLLLFGGALAALGGWYVLRPLPHPPRRVMAACSVVALPLVVGISFVGISVLDSPAALVASTAVAMGLVLALPLAGEVVATRLETPESTS